MRLVRGHARREGWAVGYMSQDMAQVTDWHGKVLGQAHVKSSWQYPCRQYQVEAVIDGVRYTGRTLGSLMLWRGKRVVGQPG